MHQTFNCGIFKLQAEIIWKGLLFRHLEKHILLGNMFLYRGGVKKTHFLGEKLNKNCVNYIKKISIFHDMLHKACLINQFELL